VNCSPAEPQINLTGLTDADEAIDRLLLEPLVATQICRQGGQPYGRVGWRIARDPAEARHAGLALTMVEVKARKSAFLRGPSASWSSTPRVENARYEGDTSRAPRSADVVSIRAVRVDPRALVTVQAFLRPRGSIMFPGSGCRG
jgi:16S rRNA G527 N7-methylase RsmG